MWMFYISTSSICACSWLCSVMQTEHQTDKAASALGCLVRCCVTGCCTKGFLRLLNIPSMRSKASPLLTEHCLMLAACAADPNADIPLGRVDIPIKEILREAARPSGQRLASAAKVAYKLRQAAQRARAAVEARHAADMLR